MSWKCNSRVCWRGVASSMCQTISERWRPRQSQPVGSGAHRVFSLPGWHLVVVRHLQVWGTIMGLLRDTAFLVFTFFLMQNWKFIVSHSYPSRNGGSIDMTMFSSENEKLQMHFWGLFTWKRCSETLQRQLFAPPAPQGAIFRTLGLLGSILAGAQGLYVWSLHVLPHVRLTGDPKLSLGVNVSEWLFVSVCWPCDRLSRVYSALAHIMLWLAPAPPLVIPRFSWTWQFYSWLSL